MICKTCNLNKDGRSFKDGVCKDCVILDAIPDVIEEDDIVIIRSETAVGLDLGANEPTLVISEIEGKDYTVIDEIKINKKMKPKSLWHRIFGRDR